MKSIALIITLVATLMSIPLSSAAESKDVFSFSRSTLFSTSLENQKIAENTEAPKPATEWGVKPESTIKKESEALLLLDAEEIIKNKLVLKYRTRIDQLIARLSTRLATLTPDEQRETLSDLLERVIEKKEVIVENTTLEQFKKDIILSILEHLIIRVEWVIHESAQQVDAEKIQA